MTQILPETQYGNIWGKIGKSLGEGLAEQIPKEAAHQRLSQGLEKFQQESQGKTPFQQAIDLYKVKGVTPEMGYTLTPLLRQQQGKEANVNYAKNLKGGKSGNKSDQGKGNNPEGEPSPGMQGPKGKGKKSITPLNVEQALRTENPPPTQADIQTLAAEIYEGNKDLFQTQQEYENEASKRLTSEYNAREATRKQAGINEAEKADIEKQFDTRLGKVGVDLGAGFGEYRSKMLNEAFDEVAAGNKTKLDAVNDAEKKARSVAEDLTRVQAMGKEYFPDAKGHLSAIKEMNKKFEELGESKLFGQTIQAELGITPSYQKFLTNPYSKEMKGYLDTVKTNPDIYSGQSVDKNTFKSKRKVSDQEIAANIAKNLGEKDSILASLLNLTQKGYDANKILSEVKKLNDANKLSLTQLQADELKENPNRRPSIDDMYYFGIWGLPNFVE